LTKKQTPKKLLPLFGDDGWVHIGGDLEAKKSPTDRYVDIRVRQVGRLSSGRSRTRIFLDARAIKKALALAQRTDHAAFTVPGLAETLAKYRAGDLGDMFSQQFENDLVDVMREDSEGYRLQIKAIGDLLVRAKILTRLQVNREGLWTALVKKFGPSPKAPRARRITKSVKYVGKGRLEK
jgi:hypothetical protein